MRLRGGPTTIQAVLSIITTLTVTAVPVLTNPTIVIVQGNWSPPSQWSLLLAELMMTGFRPVIKTYPSQNSKNPGSESLDRDTAFIRDQLLLPEINAGREVVFFLHSYGGHVGPLAAHGLSQRERSAQGKPGGIIGFVMLAAFLSLEGQSLISTLPGGVYPTWTLERANGNLDILDPRFRLYNDAGLMRQKFANMTYATQSSKPFRTPVGAPAWASQHYNDRRVYLRTALDNAISLSGQQYLIDHSGVAWKAKIVETDHGAFLSKPKVIGKEIVVAAKAFQALGAK